jgi:hypothetical protein
VLWTDKEKFKTKTHENGKHLINTFLIHPSISSTHSLTLSWLHMVGGTSPVWEQSFIFNLEGREDYLHIVCRRRHAISYMLFLSSAPPILILILNPLLDCLCLDIQHIYDKETFSDKSIGRADIGLKQLKIGETAWYYPLHSTTIVFTLFVFTNSMNDDQ